MLNVSLLNLRMGLTTNIFCMVVFPMLLILNNFMQHSKAETLRMELRYAMMHQAIHIHATGNPFVLKRIVIKLLEMSVAMGAKYGRIRRTNGAQETFDGAL